MGCRRILLVLGLCWLINPVVATTATADDRPASKPAEAKQVQISDAKQAREKFAKLLLPAGPRKSTDKTLTKRRGVVINAFGGGTRVRLP